MSTSTILLISASRGHVGVNGEVTYYRNSAHCKQVREGYEASSYHSQDQVHAYMKCGGEIDHQWGIIAAGFTLLIAISWLMSRGEK